jgi:hypothetical protein
VQHTTTVPTNADGTLGVVPPGELDRDTVEFADGTSGRVYFHDHLEQPVPSVTTVKSIRRDPDKDDAIDGWMDSYDGTDKWSCPHWADQKEYKANRGTLGHYAILSKLGDLERSQEEDDAEYALKHWDEERPTIKHRGGTYEGDPIPAEMLAPNEADHAYHDGEDAWERCMRDINWVIREFNEVMQDKGITEDDVLDVEKYVIDEEFGYAGQFDLLYEDDGDIVLSDLKLSSGIRIGYRLQLAAYANALDEHVDRLEVIRLYPDKQEVEIEDSRDWDRSVRGLCYEFLGLADRFHAEKLRPLDEDYLHDQLDV